MVEKLEEIAQEVFVLHMVNEKLEKECNALKAKILSLEKRLKEASYGCI